MSGTFADPTLPGHRARLLEFLGAAFGSPIEAIVDAPVLITAGAGMQNRNYACTVRVDGSTVSCVLRCQPEQIMEWRRDWDYYDLEREFRVLRELPALGLSVPTPVAFGLDDTLGTPAFVMHRLPGEPMSHTPVAELLPAYASLVAETATIPGTSSEWLATHLVHRTNAHLIEWADAKSHDLAGYALRDFSLSWLRERRPPSRPLTVAHGDPNPGNVLIADGRITGLVDWEFACLTDDPLAALMRVTWIYHSEHAREAFCAAMGRQVDDLAWHMALGLFRDLYVIRHGDRAAREAELAAVTGYAPAAR